MLETIREYAQDKLEANGGTAALRRHAEYCASWVTQHSIDLWWGRGRASCTTNWK